ncbi:MAG: hemerythrin domain-containing protein [Anaeromyxobacter sp.]
MANGQSSGRDLSVGNDVVDGEHGVQVQLVDALQAALAGGSDRAAAGELLDRLLVFSDMHFGSEELLMRLHSYPRYRVHVDEHHRLLDTLRELGGRIGRGDGAEPLVEDLRRWLVGHITGMDRDFASHAREFPGA